MIIRLIVSAVFVLIFFISILCFTKPSLIKQKEKPNLSTYDLLLQDERWHTKRNIILERDKHRCVKCGKITTLQVHHKYYNKYPDGKKVNPWDYPNDALITLCDECHKEVHKTKKIKTYYRSKRDKYS